MVVLALSAARTLLVALQCSVLNEVSSMQGYKTQLEELQNTVSTIQKVLLDADAHPQLSAQQQDYVEKLKDAVYDADDLFDEFLTLSHLNKLNNGSKGALQKVSDFFSSKNSLVVAYNTFREVKKIRENLESIADNHKRLGLQIDSEPTRERREETCHYVYKSAIIGRENDVKEVVDRLLGAPDIEDTVDFLTIVGFGGLGKTTVAQLVFDDERVKKEFPMRLWVCVSDQNGHKFDVKDILSKVLHVKGHNIDDPWTLVRAFSLFQKTFGGKKCLLVLDDVWNEKPHEWSELREYLMEMGRGSRVLATTRSVETAKVIGGGDTRTYDLKGLSDEDSSNLFNLTAFGDEREHEVSRNPDLVEISEKILKKCSNVPLAIKVAGSLLFGQEMSKWRDFEENGLRGLSGGGDNIIPILKLSYDNLESSLKSCFSYCAVFPKDFVIEKEMLISLWMAQGYIEEYVNGQSLKDVGNDHFSILLRRCFFQDVEMDEYGDIMSCKVHDLMHDVAQEVAGREMCVASYFRSNSDYQKARHLFENERNFKDGIFMECKVRSYLQFNGFKFGPTMLDPLVANWKCLRTLTINCAPLEELPSSIGKLLHLRYINLYYCRKLQKLPNTITNLHNLQTLILKYCRLLRELPEDLNKLVHLRHLDISNCDELTYMPSGMGKLTCLTRLNEYKVGNGSSRGQLKDLKGLVNLRGHLSIIIPGSFKWVEENEGESGYLVGMEHLMSVRVVFDDEERVEGDETLMSKLQPHANLRKFELWNYMGQRIPRWGDNWASFLPNLVHINLQNCEGLQHLPAISQLEHLRSLKLYGLDDLEYVEEDRRSDGGTSSSRSVTFFRSLDQVIMKEMPKVKGWWGKKGVELVANEHTSSFPLLTKLTIWGCPNLIAMPSCPSVEELHLEGVNRRLRLKANPHSEIKVREVRIGHVTDLKALPPCHLTRLSISNEDLILPTGVRCLSNLQELSIPCNQHLEANLEMIDCLSSLISLTITFSSALKSIPVGMRSLTSLHRLRIHGCSEELKERCRGPHGEDWPKIQHIPNHQFSRF